LSGALQDDKIVETGGTNGPSRTKSLRKLLTPVTSFLHNQDPKRSSSREYVVRAAANELHDLELVALSDRR